VISSVQWDLCYRWKKRKVPDNQVQFEDVNIDLPRKCVQYSYTIKVSDYVS